jgi:hypothetical protein
MLACWISTLQRLTAEELVQAILGKRASDHALARWATELAGLHSRARGVVAAEIARIMLGRAELVHAIDVWTEHHIPQHRSGARLHTETLGSVIDRLASIFRRACGPA